MPVDTFFNSIDDLCFNEVFNYHVTNSVTLRKANCPDSFLLFTDFIYISSYFYGVNYDDPTRPLRPTRFIVKEAIDGSALTPLVFNK